MYSFVIFDVDGTLIDTEKVVMDSYRKVAFDVFGRLFTNEELLPAYGTTTPKAMERFGIQDVERACSLYYKYLFEAFAGVKPFQGIEELLEALKIRGVRSGIVTSRCRDEVYCDPALKNILKYFSFVMSTEDTEKHKPDPEPALVLLEKAGADKSKAIFLGDTYYDFKCAGNAGIKFALAAWGARHTESIKADYILNKPEDLLALVGA